MRNLRHDRPKSGKRRLAGLGLLVAGLLLVAFAETSTTPPRPQGDISMAFGSPGPATNLRVSRPRLVWEVWGKGTNEVTAWKMTLNDQDVPAQYDAATKTLWYRPDAPLPAGTYRATAKATVSKLLTHDVSWTFTVRPDATPEPPPITSLQEAEGQTINSIRASASLPPLHLDPSLCAGAQGHAHYMAVNRMITHTEMAKGEEFLGNDPSDRVGAYGYAGSVYESVAFASHEETAVTIRSLFDAPYHRIGLLQPAALAVGTGAEKGFVAIDTAYSGSGTVVTSPANNEEVPKGAWEANEEPNPLSAHGLKGGQNIFVGYPIVVASFLRDVHVASGTGGLKGPSGDVPCLLNTPDKDGHLSEAIFIIPKAPIPAGQYSAWAEIKFNDGTTKRLDWTFKVKG